MKCDRCGEDSMAHTISMFNLDILCLPCKSKEREHPKYTEAAKAELEACENGDLNFPGIGKPDDL